MQRHARALLGAMDGLLPPDVELVCLTPPEPFDLPTWKQIEVRRVGRSTGNLWEQLDLPLAARNSLLFSPANIGPFHYANQVATLHDASIYVTPQAYSRAFRAKYSFVFQQLARRARRLLTVSAFSGGELAERLGIAPERFTVIHNGCDHLDDILPDDAILSKHNLQKDGYLLVVASQSAHKNLQNLFAALRQVESPVRVVAAGGSFSRVFQAGEQTVLPSNVQMTGYIHDRELKALYQNALGLIFPSLYEGFGLPILEAMRHGCPVLSSNTASMPEVAGDAALYFDPRQPQDMARCLTHFLADPNLRADLRERGCARAASFTWAVAAQKTLDVLLNVGGR